MYEASLLLIGAIWLLMATVGTYLPLPDPNQQVLSDRLHPPLGFGGTADHPLGTDALGRDILSRLVEGARLTMLISVVAVVLGALVGCSLGVISGFKRGRVDALITRVTEAQLALPGMLLALAIVASRGRSVSTLILTLAIFGWTQYVRVVRAETLSIRERPFVYSLRLGGASDLRIVFRHIVPNIAGTVVALATLGVGTMILVESGLSFLGLGVVSPDVSWGAMLSEGRANMRDAWWVVAIPGLAILLTVVFVNLAGDALRSRYDPRKRSY